MTRPNTECKKLSSHTLRKSLHGWSNHGMEGLWEAGGRGRKRGWKEEDIQHFEPPPTANPEYKKAKQADLDWLLWSHSAGEICLKFLDESGCC